MFFSGAITFLQPARSEDTEDGQYDHVIRATDSGKPPLFRDAKVTVKVGSNRNQKPRFEQLVYDVMIPENAKSGTKVIKLEAQDPDGESKNLRYDHETRIND